MALIEAYGEDIDFPNGTPATNGGGGRGGFSRTTIGNATSGTSSYTNQFQGGALTSAWLCFRAGQPGNTSFRMLGLSLFSSGGTKGLYIGVSSATANKIALWKYDGTTWTQLAAESGTSLIAGTNRYDMQVTSYGVSATVNIYYNSVLVISFTGDVTVSGMTNFDCLSMPVSNIYSWTLSEIMVTTDDSRSYIGLTTLALTGAGTTTQWSNNPYTNINQVAFSDSSPTYDNVNGQVQEYTVGALPSGAFVVAGIRISVRAAIGPSSAVSHLALGYKNPGGGPSYGTGSTKAPGVSFASLEQVDTINPITSAAWVSSDITSLQLVLEALT